jgi:hypothetical protein
MNFLSIEHILKTFLNNFIQLFFKGVDYCLPFCKYIMLILDILPPSQRGIEENISVLK